MEDCKTLQVESRLMEPSIPATWSCPITRSGLLNHIIFFARLQNFVRKANRCGGKILESQKHLDQKEPWEVFWYNSLLRAVSTLTLEQVPQGHVQSSAVISKDGHSTASPGNLFLVYRAHMVIIFFLTSNQNFPG